MRELLAQNSRILPLVAEVDQLLNDAKDFVGRIVSEKSGTIENSQLAVARLKFVAAARELRHRLEEFKSVTSEKEAATSYKRIVTKEVQHSERIVRALSTIIVTTLALIVQDVTPGEMPTIPLPGNVQLLDIRLEDRRGAVRTLPAPSSTPLIEMYFF